MIVDAEMKCDNPECPGLEEVGEDEFEPQTWTAGYRLPYALEPGELVRNVSCPSCGQEGVPDEDDAPYTRSRQGEVHAETDPEHWPDGRPTYGAGR